VRSSSGGVDTRSVEEGIVVLTCADAPRTLKRAEERAARRAHLSAAHMAPIEAFVERVRDAAPTSATVPSADPCDGGVLARALFLMEAPGPRAIASGFVSRNNPDETAANVFALQQEAGLERGQVLLWNIVPWYLGDGTRIRPATATDVTRGSGSLFDLLEILTQLEVAVLVGAPAQRISSRLAATGLAILSSPHPSPVPMRTRPDTRGRILAVWRQAASMLA
jgi:uracil-DNA glycosylase